MWDLIVDIWQIALRLFSALVGIGIFLVLLKFARDIKLRHWHWFERYFEHGELAEGLAREITGVVYVADEPHHHLLTPQRQKYLNMEAIIYSDRIAFNPRRPNVYAQSALVLPYKNMRIEPSKALIGENWVALSYPELEDAYLICDPQIIATAIAHGAPLRLPSTLEMENPQFREPSPTGPKARGERRPGII